VRSRLIVLATIAFAAPNAFAHGEQILYPLIAAAIIVPILAVLLTPWFTWRGKLAVLAAATPLAAMCMTFPSHHSGCVNSLLLLFGPSLSTLFIAGILYQFPAFRVEP
jgi:hypothetical protein